MLNVCYVIEGHLTSIKNTKKRVKSDV